MSTRNHSCDFFVQLEPEWGRSYGDQDKPLRAVKAVGITQKRPAKPKVGSVVVKLTVEIPDAAFHPLRPEAVVVIPESLTTPHPITVEATDPAEDSE